MAASTLPPHVSSFEKFNDEIPNDELVALVAFGFFMESERQWIECQKVEPGVNKRRNYHQSAVNSYEIERYRNEAESVLRKFSNKIAEQKRAAFLMEVLQDHKKFQWTSVWEGVVAAGAWSLMLIVVSIISLRSGIDIFEVYQRAAGIHQQQHASPAANPPSPVNAVIGPENKSGATISPIGMQTHQ